jgi:hypothetical protein
VRGLHELLIAHLATTRAGYSLDPRVMAALVDGSAPVCASQNCARVCPVRNDEAHDRGRVSDGCRPVQEDGVLRSLNETESSGFTLTPSSVFARVRLDSLGVGIPPD